MIKTIQNLPLSSGIYQYFDDNGRLLYVGKAKNLRNRVKSYWRFTPSLSPNPNLSARIKNMLAQTSRLEYIVVDSEEDALILENSLIKQLRPKYNILLRDDKTYPYIYIDESQDFPRFELTRKVIKGPNVKYYGPFPSGGRALLNALYEIYPLVQKKSGLQGGKACLFYQIGKCLAPCEGKISSQDYKKILEKAKKAIFKREVITQNLNEKMFKLATQERYEEAAKIRDQISAIEALKLKSTIDFANRSNIDIFAILNGEERGVILKLFMRNGRIISSSHSFFRQTEIFDIDEAYKQVLLDFYNSNIPSPPDEIIVSHSFDSIGEIGQSIKKMIGKNIKIKYPLRGDKKRLSNLALINAEELLKKQKPATLEIEKSIKDLIGMESVPYRIEVFDNSHMMGVATVGAMVVYNEGKWDKSSYRKYKLQSIDEYGQMREMLTRRIRNFENEPAPDLWVLDGGDANLNLAVKLLKEANIYLPVIAIAKEKLDAKAHRAKGSAKDIIYIPQGKIELKTTDKRLQWIQKLRDEAHRSAISYHKSQKRKEDMQSNLLEQKGIGKAMQKKLLDYFGNFEKIYSASYDEIAVASNKKIAGILKK